MKKMIKRYKSDAKDVTDELMSRIANIDLDDWKEYQKSGIEF